MFSDGKLNDVKKITRLLVASVISISVGSALAAGDDVASSASTDTASNFHVTGFLSVVGGNIFNGEYGQNNTSPTNFVGINCPCYTADWSNAGIYGSSFSLKPESRAGVQIQYNFTPTFNFVGQAVVRGEDGTPNIQWAYFEYKLDDKWSIHVGRQRIPLYYYSPFQDVGFAYPWIGVPPELYGWEATNYDGASLRYTNSFGENNVTSSIFGGVEKLGNSPYYTLNYTGDTDVNWSHILGADTEINRGPLTVRFVYLQTTATDTNTLNMVDDVANLHAYGMAVNLDFDTWFMLSEVTQLTRQFTSQPQYKVTAPASTIGFGYRWGQWTPFINYSLYTEHSNNFADYQPTAYKRWSATLRYDIDSNSDVKVQVDRNWDTTSTWGGNVNIFRISYDRIF